MLQRTFFTFRFSFVRSTKWLRLWDEYKGQHSVVRSCSFTKHNQTKQKMYIQRRFRALFVDCWCYNESEKNKIKCIIKCGFSFGFHCSCNFLNFNYLYFISEQFLSHSTKGHHFSVVRLLIKQKNMANICQLAPCVVCYMNFFSTNYFCLSYNFSNPF